MNQMDWEAFHIAQRYTETVLQLALGQLRPEGAPAPGDPRALEVMGVEPEELSLEIVQKAVDDLDEHTGYLDGSMDIVQSLATVSQPEAWKHLTAARALVALAREELMLAGDAVKA